MVGVDGSEGSKDALRWAVRQAGFTGATVRAVIAWQYPAFFGWVPVAPDDGGYPQIAEQTLASTLAEVMGPESQARVQARVVEGYAGQILTEASADAELLVVGSRGYGAFADALLGSVSTYCVHHAHCPVTIIRPGGHAHRDSPELAARSTVG
ncbi:MAG TPA: universal stress protein [Streptosporangiaceae bacterium]